MSTQWSASLFSAFVHLNIIIVVGMTTVSNGAVSARGLLTEMAQAVRAPDCPWSDVTRLVLEVAPCR